MKGLNSSQIKWEIPQPSSSSFLNERKNKLKVIDKIEYVPYALVWYKGARFPKKGFPYPEAVYSVAHVKRILTIALKNPLLFLVFPFKKYAHFCLKPHYLKHYTPACEELKKVGGHIIATIFEYDETYRYRVQDVLMDMGKPSWREKHRMVQLGKSREALSGMHMEWKWNLLYFIPCRLLKKLNTDNIALDEADWYWCLIKKDYNYRGLTLEQRLKIREQYDRDPSPIR